MNRCFSNSSARQDWLKYEMEKFGKDVDVLIAVAFFTDSDFIRNLIRNGCNVRMIVSLGYPTGPAQLSEILTMKNVYVRYFTKKFHPKLYIFGDDVAFVGSSNLTDGGLISNAELNLSITSDDPVFDTLKQIFYEYWNEASPLTSEKLILYSQSVSSLDRSYLNAEEEIGKNLGDVVFPNYRRDVVKKLKVEEFETSYLKRYQVFLGEFKKLLEAYEYVGKRKISEKELPIRIEIDQFLNWIRVKKASGESYMQAPVRKGDELTNFLYSQINEFLLSEHPYLDVVANEKYPKIKHNFFSEEKLDALSQEELIDTLLVAHAFLERQRFYLGGLKTLKHTFIEDNGIIKIRNSIKYLLFGGRIYTKRIADCIFNSDYRLRHFGPNCVQEIYGWVYSTKTPICNGRTLKSMQWLGFGRL